jgi:homoserine kinase
MALSRYLKLSVFRNDEWQFSAETETVAGIPQGTDNLIYQLIRKLNGGDDSGRAASEAPCKGDVTPHFDMGGRQLFLIAISRPSIELADELCGLQLSESDKLHLASLEEGHPDNAAASLAGGRGPVQGGCHSTL